MVKKESHKKNYHDVKFYNICDSVHSGDLKAFVFSIRGNGFEPFNLKHLNMIKCGNLSVLKYVVESGDNSLLMGFFAILRQYKDDTLVKDALNYKGENNEHESLLEYINKNKLNNKGEL
jgi:hypothetical protein